MHYELKTTCNFGEVWEDTAPGKDALSNLMAWPVKKVGHLRADHDGYRWYVSYFPCNDHLKTAEVASEMTQIGQYLMEELFSGKNGRQKLFDFCAAHPEAVTESDPTEYNFYINGAHINCWIRAITRVRDYNLYIHTFVK